jgi:hypothetical protein
MVPNSRMSWEVPVWAHDVMVELTHTVIDPANDYGHSDACSDECDVVGSEHVGVSEDRRMPSCGSCRV